MKMVPKTHVAEAARTTHAHVRMTMTLALLLPPGLATLANAASADLTSSSVSLAGDAAAAGEPASLDEVVVTGTREQNVKARDSVAPIDVIPAAALVATGATDLRDALERTIPSLNRQSFGGDLGNLTDSIQLRGLSPDHVLILVNGKRRHTTASIYADGGPLQGSAPVDIDLIPISAIDHIEVLRDGAAAQYGSDAIAGVINIILKSADHGGGASVLAGEYYKRDGFTGDVGADAGTTLGEDGFFHLSADYLHHDHSVRSGADSRTGVVDNLIFGDPLINRISAAYNAGKSLANGAVEVYSFATYAHRDAESYENYRLPTVLPAVYPTGFSPQETIAENDFSVTVGVKGDELLGWHWDLASTYGSDDDHFGLVNSGNPSLYAATGSTPTTFDIASFKNSQWTNNLDFVRPFDIGLAGPFNVAFGGEWRRETYKVGPGQPESYIDGGSQSFQGLAPVNAGSYSRNNYAAYVDLAATPVTDWQLDLAGRYEHYSDFGRTTNGKLSTRYDFTPRLAVRATVSTGFRAPSLAQEFFSDLNVSPTGASGQLAARSPAATLLGATQLQPEKSNNFSVGVVAEPIERLHTTLDAYLITIRNRIIDGGTYAGAQAIDALAANGITLPPGINPADVSAVYFSNGANTKTYGADFTADYRSDFGDVGIVDWDGAANYNHTVITRIGLDGNGNPLLNAQTASYLATAQPQSKIIVGGTWRLSGWRASLHEIRYGKSVQEDSYYSGPNAFSITTFYKSINNPKYVTNIETGYEWSSGFSWVVGANNLFNVYPKELPAAQRYIGTALYDASTGVGIDGGYYYTRVAFKF
jgi:iron complex outermembrane receptor protein